MFNIIRRKKKLEVRFFTQEDGLVELFAPQKLSRFTPDWWKNTPSTLPEVKGSKTRTPAKLRKTAKHCYSIQKTFEAAIAFPLWCDAFVEVLPDGRTTGVAPSNQKGLGEQHPTEQYPGLLNRDWANYKFGSPWVSYTEENIQFWMTDPFYHKQNRDWQTMPGVIEFYHQHHTNVNTILRTPPLPKKGQKGKGFQYEFHAGDIMAYFVPRVGDRKITIKAEQVSEKEWQRLHFGNRIWWSPATQHRKLDIGGCPIKIGSSQ